MSGTPSSRRASGPASQASGSGSPATPTRSLASRRPSTTPRRSCGRGLPLRPFGRGLDGDLRLGDLRGPSQRSSGAYRVTKLTDMSATCSVLGHRLQAGEVVVASAVMRFDRHLLVTFAVATLTGCAFVVPQERREKSACDSSCEQRFRKIHGRQVRHVDCVKVWSVRPTYFNAKTQAPEGAGEAGDCT